jgi:putative acetyltransferase
MKVADVRTRRATTSDAEAIAIAHADSIRSIGPQYYPPAVVDAWAAGLTADLYVTAMRRGEVFFVAVGTIEGEQAILGFSSHRADAGQHRTAVYVRRAASRRGIGSTLYRLAEADALAAGATSIHVDASLAAVGFYKANGFDEIGRGDHRLRTGQTMACVFMRKPIGSQTTEGRRHGDKLG